MHHENKRIVVHLNAIDQINMTKWEKALKK